MSVLQKQKEMKIDVMTQNGSTYYHTLDYPHCALFKLDMDDVFRFVRRKLPTLKYRKDVMLVIGDDSRQQQTIRMNS